MKKYLVNRNFLAINMPGKSGGFCNDQNSNVFTRKCEHLFDDQTMIDRYQDHFSCFSLGCCPLKNASTGINECTIIPRDHGITRTLNPLKFHMVKHK